MAISWGGLAGGLSEGIESGQRMRLARQREARAQEEFGLRRRRFEREEAQLDRDAQMWEELNGVIAKHSQKRAAAQTPTAVRPPQTEDLSGGAVATPVQNPAEGMQVREIGPDEPAPGLPRTAPAQAPAAAPQVPPQAEPTQKIGFELFRNTHLLRDPEFLNEAAQVFIKARKPEGIKWLERSFQAQQQNGIDALRALMVGDRQRALQLLNMSGQNVQDIRPITEGPDRGKWMVVAPSGQSRVLDPGQELKTFLDPKQFFELQNKERDDARAERKTDAEVTMRGAQTDYYKAQADAARRNAASLERYRRQAGDAAVTRAGGAGGAKPLTEKDYATMSARIDTQLRMQFRETAPTDPTGKKLPNPLSHFLPDIRNEIMADVRAGVDPTVAYNDRYLQWVERLDHADRLLTDAFDAARKAGSGWTKGRDDAVKSLRASIQELARQGIPVEEQRRFAQALGKDMKLFREAAEGVASGRVSPAASQRRATSARKPPPGIPQDAKPIGRAKSGPDKGKVVWEAPDGKRYVGDEE